jgi:hypothetical protein
MESFGSWRGLYVVVKGEGRLMGKKRSTATYIPTWGNPNWETKVHDRRIDSTSPFKPRQGLEVSTVSVYYLYVWLTRKV